MSESNGKANPIRTEVLPGIYVYANGYPVECIGRRYRVHRMVLDVPTYQRKVLIEALDGSDAGLWFVCSVSNFFHRYQPAGAT